MLKRGNTTNINQQQFNAQRGDAPATPVQGGLADLHKAMSGIQPVPPPAIEAELLPDPAPVLQPPEA
jgi:hypothetical protein